MGSILDVGFRSGVIGEILGEENKQRKEESLRRFEIYRQRQRQFILDRLENEFSVQTVREMRTITSINLTKRIIDEMASLYKKCPEREYSDATEAQAEYLDNLYKFSMADVKLKQANRFYKLEDQCAIQVLPKEGKLEMRVLMPHHYDVIPDPMNPEKPLAYILNILDKTELFSETSGNQDLAKAPTGGEKTRYQDYNNQKIGDPEDYKDKAQRYVWWTKDYNFVTNENGTIIDMQTGAALENLTEDDPRITNPLGKLPFVDVALEKDFEYWVRSSNGVVDFNIDFGVLLSDTANINRLQGYSQAVISSVSVPRDMHVGPHSVLHLPLDPNNPDVTPSFQFATPSPDMASSLELLEVYVRFFLTSQGQDPKTVSGKAEGQGFSSGIERLLSLVEKFEASQDDMDLFKYVEYQVFELFKDWSDVLLNVPEEAGGLKDEYNQVRLSDSIKLNVTYEKPMMLQTQTEREDSAIKLMNAGLLSRVEALMDLRGVDEDMAREIAERIDNEDVMALPMMPVGESQDESEPQRSNEESEAEDQPE